MQSVFDSGHGQIVCHKKSFVIGKNHKHHLMDLNMKTGHPPYPQPLHVTGQGNNGTLNVVLFDKTDGNVILMALCTIQQHDKDT